MRVQSRADYILLALLALTLIALYWSTVKEIALICWTYDDYSHGLLLPFISAYLIWEEKAKLKELMDRPSSFSKLGLLGLIVGLLIFLVGVITQSTFVKWASLFPTLLGAVGLCFGSPLALAVAPMIVLNYMAKPLPDSLVPRLFGPLQVLAAKVSAAVLEILNVPVYLLGNVIEIPGMKLLVEEACSGMRSLMALITVALILICFQNLSRVGKVGIILLSIVVAISLNVVRVALTGVLAFFYDPDSASGFFHTFSGMVVFVVGLGILYYMSRFLPQNKNAV